MDTSKPEDGPLEALLRRETNLWIEALVLPSDRWEPDPKLDGVQRAALPLEAVGRAHAQELGAHLGRRNWRRKPGNALVPGPGMAAINGGHLRVNQEDLGGEGPGDILIDLPTAPGAFVEYLGLDGGLQGESVQELRLGTETRRVVAGLTPLEWIFQVQLPASAVLDVGMAVRSYDLLAAPGAVRTRPGGETLGPTFRVQVELEGGDRSTVWERTPGEDERDRYLDARIDLAEHSGELVRLILSCDSPPSSADSGGDWRSVGLWAEPTVWSRVQADVPNIIVLLLDTLRADRLGCYGWERARTPVLDALAGEGVLFEDAMSAASWTLPAHASLFTSSYPSQHGLWQDVRLSERHTTVAEALRAGGYRTAAFAEGGFLKHEHGFARGFERFDSKGRDCGVTFELARQWMERSDGPFFAFVHTYKVHAPYDPDPSVADGFVRPYDGDTSTERLARVGVNRDGKVPDPGLVRYLSDLYDAEIAELDTELGVWFGRLEAAGLLENTLLVVTSDHGEEFFEHGAFAHGASLYQEQLHVPLILRWKGHFEGGVVVPETVHTVDLAPTLTTAAGLPEPGDWIGWPLSTDPGSTDRALFTPMRVRWTKGGRRGEPAVALRKGRWKYLDYPGGLRVLDPQEGPRLYDLDADPQETQNLLEGTAASTWAEQAAELWARFPELEGVLPFDLGEAAQKELQDLGYVGEDD